jgi:tripartite-type tricarboxylate transporter receptor subunit TctC
MSPRIMSTNHPYLRIGLVAVSILGPLTSSAGAQSVADFYHGKQIDLIIATEAASVYDIWARALGRHWSKYVPGHPTFVPKNMPGAGHLRAATYAFSAAPKDGSAIVTFSHNIPASFVMGNPAIKFDVSKFQWLGSPNLPGRVCVIRPDAKVQKASELFDQEVLVAGTGPAAAISQTPRLLTNLLGMKFRLIEGYKGLSDAWIALERGEVDSFCSTNEGISGVRPNWIEEGKLRVLFNMERKIVPEFKAPTIYDFVSNDEQRQILGFYGSTVEFGIPFAAPPGMPADRVHALRRALEATVKDPDFLAEVERSKMKVTAVTGEELTRQMDDLLAMPPDIIKKASTLLGGNPF